MAGSALFELGQLAQHGPGAAGHKLAFLGSSQAGQGRRRPTGLGASGRIPALLGWRWGWLGLHHGPNYELPDFDGHQSWISRMPA